MHLYIYYQITKTLCSFDGSYMFRHTACHQQFIFMYFLLLSFITNPVLTAASLIYVTTTSIALTNRTSINTSSAYAIYCLVLLKTVLFRLVSIFLIIFSSTISNSDVDSASTCLKTLRQMLQSIVLVFSLFHLNSASFLLISLISLRP
jgi:hypothetical protein